MVRKALGIIPARYESSRFPGKPLAKILNKPMIQHTYESVKKSKLINEVFVATDDQRITECIEASGGQSIHTGICKSGTDRVVEATNILKEICDMNEYDIVVNIQGDEPFVNANLIDACIQSLREGHDPTVCMSTIVAPIQSMEELHDRNVVKCVTSNNGNALYFSRGVIPHNKSGKFDLNQFDYLRHIGIYAFKLNFLLKYPTLPTSSLESIEDLEQLRILQTGKNIKTIRTETSPYPGIDTPSQLKELELQLTTNSSNY